MVETILLIIVLIISIWGIMSSMIWSSELIAFSRSDMGAQALAFSLLETLESVDPPELDGSSNLSKWVKWAIERLGGSEDFVNGYKVTVTQPAANDAFRTLLIVVSAPGRDAPYRWEREINRVSSETVSDDRKAEA